MVSIENLSFSFGGRVIYEKANLHIKQGDRIGLIGRNGTGKSTLLRLITKEYQADEGQISMPNDTSIGFLNQDLLSFQSEKSILDVAQEAFAEAIGLQHEIEALLKEIETDPSEKNIERLTEKQEKFEKLGGYEMEAQASASLEMLGFTTPQLSQPLSSFSGGWRMRVILAKLLLEKPDLLMLDEPTNHLDLPTIEWLEGYLSSYPGALIIVSHDREFLNKTVNRIVATGSGQLTSYVGNYDNYEEEKELRETIQQNAYENQQQLIKQTEQFINRFRAKATKARQVQSRVKMLERIDKIEALENDAPVMEFHFKPKVTSGKEVMGLHHFTKAYGEKLIFKDSDLQVMRGDKIALVGANGKGKSTLLRMFAGSEPFDGERKPGHNIELAFYAQHQLEALNVDNTIFQELRQSGSDRTDLELRTILGAFLFSGEEIEKPIKVLSGGEKARVALAKVLISDANTLLLDEPTNHLDQVSVDMLIQALRNYEGTFLAISHSRYFIKHIANKIWYIEDYHLKEYPGDWEEYKWWWDNVKKKDSPEIKEQPKKQAKTDTKNSPPAKPPKPSKEKEKLEEAILEMEMEKEELELQLANAYQAHPEKVEEYQEKLQSLIKNLAELEKQHQKFA